MQYPSVFRPILMLAGAVIVLAAMRFASATLAPILFALFIAALLTPFYRWFKKRMSAALALILSIVILLVAGLFLVLLVGNSFTALVDSLASYEDSFVQRKEEAEAVAAEMGMTSVSQALLSALEPAALASIMAYFLGVVGSLFKNSLLILFVTIFALGEGPLFISRMNKTFGPDHYLPRNIITTLEMVISYFGLRAIVNVVVAVSTTIMLWLFGIEYAALWGVLIFFLSFVPYVGAFVSSIPPIILAYAQGGLGLAIVITLLIIIINSLSENIVAPLVMGKGLSVSPTVVFLSFVFWMYILGGLGAFVAMPLTLGLILFMGIFEETRGLAALMGTFPESADASPLKENISEKDRITS